MGTNFIPKLLTHGWSLVVARRSARADSSRAGVALVGRPGIGTASGTVGCVLGWSATSAVGGFEGWCELK